MDTSVPATAMPSTPGVTQTQSTSSSEGKTESSNSNTGNGHAAAKPETQGQDKAHEGNGKLSTSTPPAQPEVYEVMVNGKTVKMTRQEVINNASMAHAAQARFEEASKMRKGYENFQSSLQKNMITALKSEGFNDDQIRDQMEKWYTETYIDPEALSPEERKIKEYEAKLKKYQDDEQETIKKRQQEESEQLTAKQRDYLQGQIMEAIDKSGLPKTKLVASRIAFYMRENLRQGWEAPLEVIVQQVKQERQAHMSGEVGGLEGEALIQYLGEDVVNKIRKWDLAQLRLRKQNGSALGVSHQESNGQPERIYSSEVNKRLREMRNGTR
jgi:hypothetical protein